MQKLLRATPSARIVTIFAKSLQLNLLCAKAWQLRGAIFNAASRPPGTALEP